MKTKTKKQATGFTLLEALFAAMLIGLVIAAIAVSSGASTMANGIGIDLSTAEFLIEEIREQTTTMTFDEVVAYPAMPINPPIDISGTAMPEFSAFSQQVSVQYLNEANLQTVVAGPTGFVRVTVTITKNNTPLSSASWVRAQL